MLKILLVVLLIAVVIYGVTRVVERRGIKPPTMRREPPRIVAPDDDPDFLWDLDRRKRHPGPKSDPKADPSPPDPASDDETDTP
ncbi:hypothetical protein [Nocardioides gilvus]|uniref:hypothetical protein n=1 Tax=Nocardioides gilvus TaxID=1735589 RepID=UPI000D746D07|nr:hypothetical protein [Nocardioides gilvus]